MRWRRLQEPELVYAAQVRCPCGAGVAYIKDGNIHGYWDCSEILLGIADHQVRHTAQLPFTFYEIKSENQSEGITTRPSQESIQAKLDLAEAERERLATDEIPL